MNDTVDASQRWVGVLLVLALVIAAECLFLKPLPRHPGTETCTDPATGAETTRPAMVLEVDEGNPDTYSPRMWVFLGMLVFSYAGGVSCYATFAVGLACLVGYGYLPPDVPAPAMCVYMGLAPVIVTVLGFYRLLTKLGS